MMATRKTKILQRAEEISQETKRPRTPEKLDEEKTPDNTVPEIIFGRVPDYEPKTPEHAPPPLPELKPSPAWCDPVRPLDILGGQYPDPESYDFQITKSKKVENDMQVFFVGIRHGYGGRAWNFTVQSPPSSIRFTQLKIMNEHPESRVFIAPKAPDGFFTPYPSEYLAFIDHIEHVAIRLKREMEELGMDTTHWKLPMKFTDGICQGIYAKVKSDPVRRILKGRANNVKCTLKLTCVFFSRENSGLSFEIIHAM